MEDELKNTEEQLEALRAERANKMKIMKSVNMNMKDTMN